jgi:hypothetical protein
MDATSSKAPRAAVALVALVLAACGGSGGGVAPTTYTVGGTVNGLSGSGLVLRDNGDDDFKITANGAFTFATRLTSGTAYAAPVSTDSAGNVYVADTFNATIRKITPDGMVSTVVGVPNQAGFAAGVLPGLIGYPLGIVIVGSSLYITLYNGIAVVQDVP